jgi:hypothetical protein
MNHSNALRYLRSKGALVAKADKGYLITKNNGERVFITDLDMDEIESNNTFNYPKHIDYEFLESEQRVCF